jgi:hypothetical protein
MNASHVRVITRAGLLGCFFAGSGFALGLADLANQDAARGIKGALDTVAKGMRMFGQGKEPSSASSRATR